LHDVLLWDDERDCRILAPQEQAAQAAVVTAPSGIVAAAMSPTVFRDGPFRFFFFSREEDRLHIHVQSPDGEAKFWIDPEIELARNYQLSAQDVSRALQLVIDHEQEIRDAWNSHFGR
jgi:Domain of unknown function (DUF4160)